MTLWFVSMECANIAEAGGVKNVAFSLCKEFALLGHKVSLFIPVFKWNKHYYVKTSCCQTVYELDPETGEDILYGDKVEIMPKHLMRVVHAGYRYSYKRCRTCGYETADDFDFCPKCGNRF